MEQRRVYGKNHWYHETQSTNSPVEVLPLVPEAAHVEDRFLLDLTLPDELSHPHEGWLTPARQLAKVFFPTTVTVNRLQTFSAYERLSTALTVAQVYGVQRLCNHYAARLAPLPALILLGKAIDGWRKSPSMPASWQVHRRLSPE